MSDMLERWLWVESRGKPDGQQKDVQYIIDNLYPELKRQGIPRRHVGGGYRAKDDPDREKERDYVKERFIPRNRGQVKGGRRSDIAFELGEGNKTETLDVNVIDTLADGKSPTKREREAFEAIVELKARREKGDTVMVPKSKKMTDAEYETEIKKWVEEYVAAVKERLIASGRFPQ